MSCSKLFLSTTSTISLLLLSCRVEFHRRNRPEVQIMPQSVAVAIVHGIGRQKEDFASAIIQQLRMRVRQQLGEDPQEAPRFFFQPVYWAPVLQNEEDELWSRLRKGGSLGWTGLREFMVDFAADAIAYQPIEGRCDAYDRVHAVFADSLRRLAEQAGPRATLCVISHSLGTVIASNFFYDLQALSPEKPLIAQNVLEKLGDTPLARGETLTVFYTMGSPIALWSLRYENFGKPVHVPSPKLHSHYPNLAGEWVNFYCKADVIGYPLKELNADYRVAVTSDCSVLVGGPLAFWNPLSHMAYFGDTDGLRPIAEGLVGVWQTLNTAQG